MCASVYYGNKAKQRLSGIFFEPQTPRPFPCPGISLAALGPRLSAQLYTFLWLEKIYARPRLVSELCKLLSFISQDFALYVFLLFYFLDSNELS